MTQRLCLIGRQENYDLRIELSKFAKDENGHAYVTFADSNPIMKTRKSSSTASTKGGTGNSKNGGY